MQLTDVVQNINDNFCASIKNNSIFQFKFTNLFFNLIIFIFKMMAFKLMCELSPTLNGSKIALFSPTKMFITRFYSQQGRETIWRTTRTKRRAFAESLTKPAGDTGIS